MGAEEGILDAGSSEDQYYPADVYANAKTSSATRAVHNFRGTADSRLAVQIPRVDGEGMNMDMDMPEDPHGSRIRSRAGRSVLQHDSRYMPLSAASTSSNSSTSSWASNPIRQSTQSTFSAESWAALETPRGGEVVGLPVLQVAVGDEDGQDGYIGMDSPMDASDTLWWDTDKTPKAKISSFDPPSIHFPTRRGVAIPLPLAKDRLVFPDDSPTLPTFSISGHTPPSEPLVIPPFRTVNPEKSSGGFNIARPDFTRAPSADSVSSTSTSTSTSASLDSSSAQSEDEFYTHVIPEPGPSAGAGYANTSSAKRRVGPSPEDYAYRRDTGLAEGKREGIRQSYLDLIPASGSSPAPRTISPTPTASTSFRAPVIPTRKSSRPRPIPPTRGSSLKTSVSQGTTSSAQQSGVVDTPSPSPSPLTRALSSSSSTRSRSRPTSPFTSPPPPVVHKRSQHTSSFARSTTPSFLSSIHEVEPLPDLQAQPEGSWALRPPPPHLRKSSSQPDLRTSITCPFCHDDDDDDDDDEKEDFLDQERAIEQSTMSMFNKSKKRPELMLPPDYDPIKKNVHSFIPSESFGGHKGTTTSTSVNNIGSPAGPSRSKSMTLKGLTSTQIFGGGPSGPNGSGNPHSSPSRASGSGSQGSYPSSSRHSPHTHRHVTATRSYLDINNNTVAVRPPTFRHSIRDGFASVRKSAGWLRPTYKPASQTETSIQMTTLTSPLRATSASPESMRTNMAYREGVSPRGSLGSAKIGSDDSYLSIADGSAGADIFDKQQESVLARYREEEAKRKGDSGAFGKDQLPIKSLTLPKSSLSPLLDHPFAFAASGSGSASGNGRVDMEDSNSDADGFKGPSAKPILGSGPNGNRIRLADIAYMAPNGRYGVNRPKVDPMPRYNSAYEGSPAAGSFISAFVHYAQGEERFSSISSRAAAPPPPPPPAAAAAAPSGTAPLDIKRRQVSGKTGEEATASAAPTLTRQPSQRGSSLGQGTSSLGDLTIPTYIAPDDHEGRRKVQELWRLYQEELSAKGIVSEQAKKDQQERERLQKDTQKQQQQQQEVSNRLQYRAPKEDPDEDDEDLELLRLEGQIARAQRALKPRQPIPMDLILEVTRRQHEQQAQLIDLISRLTVQESAEAPPTPRDVSQTLDAMFSAQAQTQTQTHAQEAAIGQDSAPDSPMSNHEAGVAHLQAALMVLRLVPPPTVPAPTPAPASAPASKRTPPSAKASLRITRLPPPMLPVPKTEGKYPPRMHTTTAPIATPGLSPIVEIHSGSETTANESTEEEDEDENEDPKSLTMVPPTSRRGSQNTNTLGLHLPSARSPVAVAASSSRTAQPSFGGADRRASTVSVDTTILEEEFETAHSHLISEMITAQSWDWPTPPVRHFFLPSQSQSENNNQGQTPESASALGLSITTTTPKTRDVAAALGFATMQSGSGADGSMHHSFSASTLASDSMITTPASTHRELAPESSSTIAKVEGDAGPRPARPESMALPDELVSPKDTSRNDVTRCEKV